MKISVVIIAKNEEAKIGDCLASAAFSDDIIVVDDNSTDRTPVIAEQAGARVFPKKMRGYATQKNFGIAKAKNSWVLILDADERITPELQKSIVSTDSQKGIAGYEIAFRNYVGERWLKHGGLYPDYHVRLFDKSTGQYGKREVHESLELDGDIRRLQGDIIHLTYDNYAAYLNKVKKYSVIQAQEDYRLDNSKFKVVHNNVTKEFLHKYIRLNGWLDGFAGLKSALLLAYYRYLYCRELKRLTSS